ASPAAPKPPVSDEPTPEQTAIIAELHRLVHQGHVLEFADGRMDTAKKPVPKPPKPEKKSTQEKPAAEGDTTTTTVDPAGEAPVLTEAEIPTEPSPAVEAAAETPATAEPATEVPAGEPAPDVPATEPTTGENPPPA
ncbi:MAG: hypothetical protein ACLP2Y_07360, partial [Limisphaerales bacterium]